MASVEDLQKENEELKKKIDQLQQRLQGNKAFTGPLESWPENEALTIVVLGASGKQFRPSPSLSLAQRSHHRSIDEQKTNRWLGEEEDVSRSVLALRSQAYPLDLQHRWLRKVSIRITRRLHLSNNKLQLTMKRFRSSIPLEDFRTNIGKSLKGHDDKKEAFLKRCFYFHGQYDSVESLKELSKVTECFIIPFYQALQTLLSLFSFPVSFGLSPYSLFFR